MRLPLMLIAAASIATAVAATTQLTACAGLSGQSIPNATIKTAERITAGSFPIPGQQSTLPDLPPFCRVAGTLHPSNDSDIQFEVWLPDEANWNARYLGAGNGGFAGSISYSAIASALRRGYATASTDTGHTAAGGFTIDASWADGHPEKLIDYGYRAIHETTVTAKALVKAFYQKKLEHSYFSSCSNGGRQALMEVQRYPEDFDGIIAGAPANNFTHIASEFVWIAQGLAAGYIPSSKLPAIAAANLNACDAADGVKDGVLDDPRQCKFDPGTLLCKGNETDTCLTAPQIDALHRIYDGTHDARGHEILAGYERGGETGLTGWTGWITGASLGKSAQFGFGTQMYARMVYSNKDWDYKTFDLNRDTKAADLKIGKVLNATDANLRPFVKHGGKLILYHGWCDAALPPRNTIEYYEAVRTKLGPKVADTFVRLYMLPGVQHCGGGPGPNHYGDFDKEPDATSNMLLALERWVESGVAPSNLTAVRYQNNRPASGVERSRPICAYPQVAKYKGSGSTDDATNFECKLP
jgi:feruloyl esterase